MSKRAIEFDDTILGTPEEVPEEISEDLEVSADVEEITWDETDRVWVSDVVPDLGIRNNDILYFTTTFSSAEFTPFRVYDEESENKKEPEKVYGRVLTGKRMISV